MKGDGAVRLLFIAAVTKRRLDAVERHDEELQLKKRPESGCFA
jgi:hypothetical protein